MGLLELLTLPDGVSPNIEQAYYEKQDEDSANVELYLRNQKGCHDKHEGTHEKYPDASCGLHIQLTSPKSISVSRLIKFSRGAARNSFVFVKRHVVLVDIEQWAFLLCG